MRAHSVTGMVNAHSHAFQRALRGVAEWPAPAAAGADDFWSWRTAMFDLAERLDPDLIHDLSRAAFVEMRAAGYVAVGEFHYVHHDPAGNPYGDPNAMAKAVAEAAQAAGLPIVLLPAAYGRNGWDGSADRPAAGGQRRFCDADVGAFLERVDDLRSWAVGRRGVDVHVAAHSARACPADWLVAIAAYAEEHELVRHIHACEQPRELDEVRAEHGLTPIELLEQTGFLGPRASIVHGIHVTDRDIARIAASGTTVVTCPTTEGSLGDGYQPALRYRDAGVALAIGSDSQVRIDPFEEVRELETGARREGMTRHALLAADPELWATLARAGANALGLTEVGTIEVDLDQLSLEGIAEDDLLLALATCASASVVVRPELVAGRSRSSSEP